MTTEQLAEEAEKVPPTDSTGESQPPEAEKKPEDKPQSDQAKAEADAGEDEKAKKKDGLNKRFSELTSKRREAEARAQRAEQEAAELRKRLEGDGNKPQGKPDLANYESYDQYLEALTEWKAGETLRKQSENFAEQQRKVAEEHRQQTLREEWNAKTDIAREKYPDFDSVAYRADVTITPPVLEAILDSEMGADIAYHLGKNPDVAHRLSQMHPVSVAREIGRLEAQLSAQPAVKATNAPAPIKPVGQRAVAEKTPDEMTDEEYYAWRRQQNANRKRF